MNRSTCACVLFGGIRPGLYVHSRRNLRDKEASDEPVFQSKAVAMYYGCLGWRHVYTSLRWRIYFGNE